MNISKEILADPSKLQEEGAEEVTEKTSNDFELSADGEDGKKFFIKKIEDPDKDFTIKGEIETKLEEDTLNVTIKCSSYS